jgi:hypothetical protein
LRFADTYENRSGGVRPSHKTSIFSATKARGAELAPNLKQSHPLGLHGETVGLPTTTAKGNHFDLAGFLKCV